MRLLGNGLIAVQLGTYANWLRQDFSSQTVQNIFYDAIGGNLFEPFAKSYSNKFKHLDLNLKLGSAV